MRHPTEGVLRRLLDEPAGVADLDREHVAGCHDCLRGLAAVRHDAMLVGAALAPAGPEAEVAAGWRRLSAAAAAPAPKRVRAAAAPAGRRLRAALGRPLVAGVAAAAVLAGAGTAAASGWVEIFRTERITPVGISTADLNALPDLAAYGDVDLVAKPDVHPVADAAAAAAESGLDVPEVTGLPRGVSGGPTYQVGGEASVVFTFSAERAARAAAETGRALPAVPPGVDGSQVRLVAGPGVALTWSGSSGLPDLLVGRAVAPRAFSDSGVPFDTLRDYLLSLPGLPEGVAESLRSFNAGDSTLPLPVPVDEVTTSSAEVDGEPATVIATRDRTMAAVAWVHDGVVTVVAGPLGRDEVLAVARGLR